MPRYPHIRLRLLELLNSEILERDRSLARLSKLLGVSVGCIEYHIRQLRDAGQVERDGNGVLRATTDVVQLALGFDMDLTNVVELSAAKRARRLSDSTSTYCEVLVHLRIPGELSAGALIESLERQFGAREVRVFVESETGSKRRLPDVRDIG